MKLVTVSTALRTFLYWLLDHLRRAPRLSEPEQAAYDHEQERTRKPIVFIPVVYEPPERTTDPTQQIHRLVETGRITALIHTQKLPSVKGLHKPHFYKLEPPSEEVRSADKWLLDAEPKDEEPEDEDATSKSQAIVRLRHEGRGKAS